MNKLKILNRIKQLYMQGTNMIEYLSTLNNDNDNNTVEDIMISYDFQAGTYTKVYKADPESKEKFCKKIADLLSKLGNFNSLMEVGVGEGTTLIPLLSLLNKQPQKCFGFDISWSRIKYAKRNAEEFNISNIQFFTGDLFCSPVKDNSIDVVYTSHSIEPNGGKEKEALIELYRITNKYLILLEPSYEFANDEAKERMIRHGYVTKLYATAKELGYNIIEHRLFHIGTEPLNTTGLIIIKKDLKTLPDENPLCCPITKTNIFKQNNAYYSEDSLLAYPIIDNIPCLLPQNAIVATKFLE